MRPAIALLGAGALLALAATKGKGESTPSTEASSKDRMGRAKTDELSLYRDYTAKYKAHALEPTSIAGCFRIAYYAIQPLPEPVRGALLQEADRLLRAWEQGAPIAEVKTSLTRLVGEACSIGLRALPPSKRQVQKRLGRYFDVEECAIVDWLLAQYAHEGIGPFGPCKMVAAIGLCGLFRDAFVGSSELCNGLPLDAHYEHWKLPKLKQKQAKYNQWFREKVNRWARECNIVIPNKKKACPTEEYLDRVQTDYLTADSAPKLVPHLELLMRAVLRDKMVPWLPAEGESEPVDSIAIPIPLIH